jgi:hypothetical protein
MRGPKTYRSDNNSFISRDTVLTQGFGTSFLTPAMELSYRQSATHPPTDRPDSASHITHQLDTAGCAFFRLVYPQLFFENSEGRIFQQAMRNCGYTNAPRCLAHDLPVYPLFAFLFDTHGS